MSKKQAPRETQLLTRRDVLAIGAVAATSLYLPTGLIRSARAQTSGAQYNQDVIGQLPDFYVSPTGTGSASAGGTAADPWPISMLSNPTAQSRYAGHVVGIMDGTYGLYDIMGLPPSGNFSGDNRLQIKPGTAAQPTIIVSQTPQGAIIDGQRAAIYAADPSLDWGDGLMGPFTFSYGKNGAGITIDGLKFQGGNYRYITNYGGYGRGGNGNNGCDNLIVRNCWFTDQSYITCQVTSKNACSIYSEGQYHVYVQNCRFDNIGGAPSDGGRFACVQFYSPTQDTVIEYCTVIVGASSNMTHGNCLYWKCGPSPGHYNPVCRYNYVDASANAGGVNYASVGFDGSTDTTSTFSVHNNILITTGGEMNLWGDSVGIPGMAGIWDIHDNTFLGDWSNKGNFYGPWHVTPASENFYNNIVWPSAGGEGGQNGDLCVATLGSIGNIDYNLYPTSAVQFSVGNGTTMYSSLSSWRTASGADAHSAQHDPGFVGTGTEAAQYMVTGGYASTFASDGGQIGAWRGASQVGCSFAGGTVLAVPDPPHVTSVS